MNDRKKFRQWPNTEIGLHGFLSSVKCGFAQHTSNDNFIYERQDAIITTLVIDTSIAELYVKHQN